MSETVYPRSEVEAAFANYRGIVEGAHGKDSQDYSSYSSIFTDDLVYVEHCMGDPTGRPGSPLLARSRKEVDEWLAVTMKRDLPTMTFPLEWVLFDGNQLTFKALNRLPEPPDGSGPYEVASMSIMTYAGNGQFSYKEDIYNAKLWDKVLNGWFAAMGQHDRVADLDHNQVWA